MDKNQQLLDVLTREGVLINVSVRYWRATKKLNAEDLGLDPDNITERFISLGHKRILPKDKLEAFALIESRAHALIDGNTFPFLHGLGHFLPNAKLQEVTQRLTMLEQEFRAATEAFLTNYADVRSQARLDWFEAARLLVKDPERVVAAIEAAFPNPEKMESTFTFSVQLFQVRAPERLDIALVSVGEQQGIISAREKAAQEAAERIHQGAQSFVADCVVALRQQTAQLCEDMLESMHTGKTGVHQKTLNRLIKFIDEFKQLNFVGDNEMEAQLERVRQEFLHRSAEDYRDDATGRDRLQQGLRGLADTARELAQQDSRELVERFGQMGQRKFHLAA
jgi:hypothetical protein